MFDPYVILLVEDGLLNAGNYDWRIAIGGILWLLLLPLEEKGLQLGKGLVEIGSQFVVFLLRSLSFLAMG